jgi:hypothetical protein
MCRLQQRVGRCAGCLLSVWCLYSNDADSGDDCTYTYSTRPFFVTTKTSICYTGTHKHKILCSRIGLRACICSPHTLRTFAWHWGLSVRPTRGAGHFLCAMHSHAYSISVVSSGRAGWTGYNMKPNWWQKHSRSPGHKTHCQGSTTYYTTRIGHTYKKTGWNEIFVQICVTG